MPESPRQFRFPIMAPPRPASVHEVASVSESGRQRHNEDAVSVFALGLPQEELDVVVLAIADGLGEHSRRSGASGVAVEAFGDALGGLIGSLLLGPRWQFGLAEILETAFAETNHKIRSLPVNARGQSAATTLTAAVLAGDWLCTVHVGNSRVYRLSANELEQLTEDHAREPLALLSPVREDMQTINETGRLASALGVEEMTTPSVLFRRIAPGDVVLVCSDGLHELVAGEELARLLNVSGSLEEIGASLVAAANARGGDDNISVCLARVGPISTRLPEPASGAERLYGDVAATILPRYHVESAARWLPDRIGLVAGFVVSLALLAGFVAWDGMRTKKTEEGAKTEAAVAQVGGWAADSGWSSAPAPLAAAPPVVAPPVAEVDTVVVAASPKAAADQAPSAAVADSIASANALKREAAQARVRRVNDSLVEARMAQAERERLDSIALAAAAATRLAEQRVRDSAATADRRRQDSIAARERLDAQARTAAQAVATEREQARVRDARLVSGRAALNGWLQRVVSAVSNGEPRASALVAGPSSFAEFVEKNSPKISDASITAIEVDESSGEATAEWVLKWRGNFGTATQRKMKASATVVRDGETWRLLGWKILEGGV